MKNKIFLYDICYYSGSVQTIKKIVDSKFTINDLASMEAQSLSQDLEEPVEVIAKIKSFILLNNNEIDRLMVYALYHYGLEEEVINKLIKLNMQSIISLRYPTLNELVGKGLITNEEKTKIVRSLESSFIPEFVNIASVYLSDDLLTKKEKAKVSVIDFINTLPESREKTYFVMYLKGKTLASIGESEGVSRERVRQIMLRLRNQIPDNVYENRYFDLYNENKYTLEEFTRLFDESEEIYRYVRLMS